MNLWALVDPKVRSSFISAAVNLYWMNKVSFSTATRSTHLFLENFENNIIINVCLTGSEVKQLQHQQPAEYSFNIVVMAPHPKALLFSFAPEQT